MLQLCIYPHPALLAPTEKITTFDAELRMLGEAMLNLMYAERGVGLAAPQVGKSLRLIAIDVGRENPQPLVLANPEISKKSREKETEEEGCLSFPEIRANISRHKEITVCAQNLKGEEISLTVDGLFARCLQHEIDHLDNIFFTDRASLAARLSLRAILKEMEKQNPN